MIRVKDSEVIQTKLPQVGVLSDGRTVSGYHVLPKDILKAEGWLAEVEVKPTAKSGETIVFDRYNILKDKVEVVYRAELIPAEVAPEPSEVELLKQLLITKEVITEAELIATKEVK